jgi:hypothetical protein
VVKFDGDMISRNVDVAKVVIGCDDRHFDRWRNIIAEYKNRFSVEVDVLALITENHYHELM